MQGELADVEIAVVSLQHDVYPYSVHQSRLARVPTICAARLYVNVGIGLAQLDGVVLDDGVIPVEKGLIAFQEEAWHADSINSMHAQIDPILDLSYWDI